MQILLIIIYYMDAATFADHGMIELPIGFAAIFDARYDDHGYYMIIHVYYMMVKVWRIHWYLEQFLMLYLITEMNI